MIPLKQNTRIPKFWVVGIISLSVLFSIFYVSILTITHIVSITIVEPLQASPEVINLTISDIFVFIVNEDSFPIAKTVVHTVVFLSAVIPCYFLARFAYSQNKLGFKQILLFQLGLVPMITSLALIFAIVPIYSGYVSMVIIEQMIDPSTIMLTARIPFPLTIPLLVAVEESLLAVILFFDHYYREILGQAPERLREKVNRSPRNDELLYPGEDDMPRKRRFRRRRDVETKAVDPANTPEKG